MDLSLLSAIIPSIMSIVMIIMGILIRQIMAKIDTAMSEADVRQLIADKLAVTAYAQQQLDIRLTHIERQLDKILDRLAHGKFKDAL